jgi:hypothetical protein
MSIIVINCKRKNEMTSDTNTQNVSSLASLGHDIRLSSAFYTPQDQQNLSKDNIVFFADDRLKDLVEGSFDNVTCEDIPEDLIKERKPLTPEQMQAWHPDAISLADYADEHGCEALGKEVYLKTPKDLVATYKQQIAAHCTPAFTGEQVVVVAVNYAKQTTDQGANEGLSDEQRQELAFAQSMSIHSVVEGVRQAELQLPTTRFVLVNTQYSAPNINAAEEIQRVKAATGRNVVELVYPEFYENDAGERVEMVEKAGTPVDMSNDLLYQAAIYAAITELGGAKIGTGDSSHWLAASQLTGQFVMINVPVAENLRAPSVWQTFAGDESPTITVYEQEVPGDWSGAPAAIADYLVQRYATR